MNARRTDQADLGSAAEYLRLRREELDAEKQRQREQEDFELFEREFVAAGDTETAAKEAYRRHRNEEAEEACERLDRAQNGHTRMSSNGRW
jgi:hypothetical protein